MRATKTVCKASAPLADRAHGPGRTGAPTRFCIAAASLAGLGLSAAAWLWPVFGSSSAQGQQWQALPLVTQAQRNSGDTGGEGCQIVNGITIDPTGNFLLMGTDVGGIYRSTNGGANWQPCNVGYKPRGGTGPAIDPHNTSRCLVSGCSSSSHTWYGLYLSTNQGDTWQSVLPLTYAGAEDYREQIAYDPASLSGGMSQCVYYSALQGPTSEWGSGGLYKSVNGGQTWWGIQTNFGSSLVKVHPTLGYVYVAASNGFFLSTNGGTNFTPITNGLSPGAVQGLDVIVTAPNNVYVNQANGVYVSTNSGSSFTKRAGNGLTLTAIPGLNDLKVSPVNSNDMVIDEDTGDYSDQPVFFSSDGGNTWAYSAYDSSQSFRPFCDRHGMFAWHPTLANICFSFGGDWITKSTNGGQTFVWNNQGFNGVDFQSVFNFNVTNANLLLEMAQDANGALTTDGGYTWTYENVSGKSWGGQVYAGYAFSPTRMFAGNAASWTATRYLSVTYNGGGTWAILTNTALGVDGTANSSPTDADCGDPNNPDIGFWDNWRTTDAGATWTTMPQCTGVFTYNPSGAHELYGAYGTSVVKSTNDGASWTTVGTFSAGDIMDIAFDQVRDRLYVAAGNQLYTWQSGAITQITSKLPVDNNQAQGSCTVAVDPVDPDVVYSGFAGGGYCSSASVSRSTNAGANWMILTKQAGGVGPDGGRQPTHIRVHPATRFLYVQGGCFGFWKIGPPGLLTNNTSTTVNSSTGGASTYGQAVTFSATVSGSDGGGTVAFYADGSTHAIFGCSAISLASGGVATTPNIAFLAAGAHSISAVYSGDAASLSSTGALTGGQTVLPANQTITFGSLANQTYGVAPYSINAAAFSGLPVSFAAVLGPATVAGNTLSITGAGIVLIQASQAGNANFNPATPVTNAFVVAPLAVALTGTRPYDGTATAAAAILSVSNAIHGDVVTVASGSATLASASVGSEAVTSAGSLALGGTTASSYTLTGSSGAVTITNPFIPFSITSSCLDVTGTNMVVRWQSVPGVGYSVLTNTSLAAAGVWPCVGRPITATSTMTCFTLPGGISHTNVFVMIRQ